MEHILSVDDSAIMRKIIKGAIERIGYGFLEAENGQQALEVLSQNRSTVVLVLLDWNMPVKDGYTALLEIKQNPEYAHIPVIMVTTEGEKANIIKAIQSGAKNYIVKPFIQEDLETRMLECIGLKV